MGPTLRRLDRCGRHALRHDCRRRRLVFLQHTAYYGCGTVFSVTLGGTEKVLHNFGAGSDGRTLVLA